MPHVGRVVNRVGNSPQDHGVCNWHIMLINDEHRTLNIQHPTSNEKPKDNIGSVGQNFFSFYSKFDVERSIRLKRTSACSPLASSTFICVSNTQNQLPYRHIGEPWPPVDFF